jgi:hypothetical protein
VAKNTIRAIQLLNEVSYQNIFNQHDVPAVDIICAYRVYFQFLGNDYSHLSEKDFFAECSRIFKSKKQLGII